MSTYYGIDAATCAALDRALDAAAAIGRKAEALAALTAAHHEYKMVSTRETFRACCHAIKRCQQAGATTQEIRDAQQG